MKERSYFWPLALIACGVLWLLSNLGLLPSNNLWALIHMLPYILIALGLGLILRAFWPPAGILISLLVVIGGTLGVIYAPRFVWDEIPNWSVWRFDSPDVGGRMAGSGQLLTESRDVSDFSEIDIEYPVDITIKQGKKPSIELTGDDNLLPQLQTDVQGGVLVIENKITDWSQRVRPSQTVRVTLVVTDLTQINFTSAGTLLLDGFTGDDLQVSLSGAGEIQLRDVVLDSLNLELSGAGDLSGDGSVNTLLLAISGFGSFKGDELKTQHADVRISGAGEATLWAVRSLDVHISGAGSVRYYGQPPNFSEQISGAGSVDDLGEK
jgi:hypothetical protein